MPMPRPTHSGLRVLAVGLLVLAVAVSYCGLCLLIGQEAAYFGAAIPALATALFWALRKNMRDG